MPLMPTSRNTAISLQFGMRAAISAYRLLPTTGPSAGAHDWSTSAESPHRSYRIAGPLLPRLSTLITGPTFECQG
jgi:hypothetical protein